VPDVRAYHQKIPVADFCRAAFSGAAMNGTVLADNIVLSDPDLGFSFGGE
jgi:hypothetical protein